MIDLTRSAVVRDIADSNVLLKDHLSLGFTTLHCPALACLIFLSNILAYLYDHPTMMDDSRKWALLWHLFPICTLLFGQPHPFPWFQIPLMSQTCPKNQQRLNSDPQTHLSTCPLTTSVMTQLTITRSQVEQITSPNNLLLSQCPQTHLFVVITCLPLGVTLDTLPPHTHISMNHPSTLLNLPTGYPLLIYF